jgi:hypothetical protein
MRGGFLASEFVAAGSVRAFSRASITAISSSSAPAVRPAGCTLRFSIKLKINRSPAAETT